ncbi:hypothetical protein Fcan01_11401 [Folsomia candida]|uniref:Uncharacterized protein n=1 Tax=Folsomia candida TaxID=158441 RepID=A0A226E9I3_FOLCA|nr:hypothetical protein Fcan01_11401 [Folsomia candida]
MWDTSTKKFYYVDSVKKLCFYIWNLAGVLALSAVGTTLLVLFKEIVVKQKTIPRFNTFALTLLAVQGLSTIGIGLGFLIFGKEFTLGWNQLNKVEGEVSMLNGGRLIRGKAQKLDYLGHGMTIMVQMFILYLVFLPLGGIFLKLDPFHLLISEAASYIADPLTLHIFKLCAKLIKVYIIYVSVLETCRHQTLLFIMFATSLHTGKILLRDLLAVRVGVGKGERTLTKLTVMHQQLVLCVGLISKFQECCTTVLFGLGLFAGILVNARIIKLFNILPFYLHIYLPSSSAIIIFIIFTLVPQAQVINDYSVKILHKWNSTLMDEPCCKTRACLKRMLKSLKPVKLHVGVGEVRFFSIDRSTKGKFYVKILDNAINLSLAMPKEGLSRHFGAYALN